MEGKISYRVWSVDALINRFVRVWTKRCYPSGIPDEVPGEIADKVPNYKVICACIIKNDLHLEGLGYSRPKCGAYSELKRAELIERGVIKPTNQSKLF